MQKILKDVYLEFHNYILTLADGRPKEIPF